MNARWSRIERKSFFKFIPAFVGMLLATALGTATVGCTAPRVVTLGCSQRDWYEIGRRDGAQGAALTRLDGYRRECALDLHANNETIYLNGRNAGLVEYCQPDSAYQLGRSGQPYFNVCPPTNEPAFLANYKRGRQARELEQRGKDLEAEIESLAERILRAGNLPAQHRITTRLNTLREARARTMTELQKVTR